MDRLPERNSPEGLELLQQAWVHYDVAVHLAQRYKLVSKVVFICRLVVGWLVVLFATSRYLSWWGGDDLIFGLSLLVSLLLSVDAWVDAKARHRALQNGASSIESLIWKFRARVGQFSQDKLGEYDARSEDVCLQQAMTTWMQKLVGSADLKSTGLEQNWTAEVYCHHQFEVSANSPMTLQEDDFHTPIRPSKYIQLRLVSSMEFFRDRIPRYTWWHDALKVAQLLCAVAASVLAYLGNARYVVVFTSVAVAITGWIGFHGVSDKIVRYNSIARNIQMLITWWTALTPIEKAGVTNISQLIEQGEAILCAEHSASQGMITEAQVEEPDPKKSTSNNAGALAKSANSSNRYRVHPADPEDQ